MIEKMVALQNWMIIVSIITGMMVLFFLICIVQIKRIKNYVRNDDKEKEILLRILKLGHSLDLPKEEKPDDKFKVTPFEQRKKRHSGYHSPFAAKHYFKKFMK